MRKEDIIEEVLEAQADLQTALGFLRLEMRRIEDAISYGDEPPDSHEALTDAEELAAKSLSRLQGLLGKPMARTYRRKPVPEPVVGMMLYDPVHADLRWEVTKVDAKINQIDAERRVPDDGYPTTWTFEAWDWAWTNRYLKEAPNDRDD